jgi:hypothetical protein
MPTAGSLPLSLAPLASRQAVTITNNDFGAKVIALLKIFNKNLDELSTGGLADALSERARVEQLITGDLNELRERHERRVRASAWSVAVIILAATVIWAGWYFRPFSSNSPVSDTAAFRITEESSPASKPLPFPESHGGVEPVLYLSSVLGESGVNTVGAIQKAGKIVFQAVGSTGTAVQGTLP